MAFKQVTRAYTLSDAGLALFSSNLVVNMTRDTTEFAVRGVTAIDITAFQTLENSFEVFPTDDNLRGLVMIEVADKDVLRATIDNEIQLISGFVEQQWGGNSGQYKRLSINKIQNASDDSFLVKARGVASVATEYIATLTLIGLTQADIDSLNANAQLFEDKLNSVKSAEETRAIKTQERINLGNSVYTFVQNYTRIGKLIWENVDFAKYEDYVINPTPSSALGKVLNLAGVYIPAAGGELAKIDLSWSAVSGANGYDVYVSIVPVGDPSVQFALLSGAPTTTFQHTPLPTIPSDYYYKVQAVNPAGTGALSDEFKVEAL
jgi:hypothetical protein